MASNHYRARRLERRKEWSRNAHAAKERKRMAEAVDEWRPVRTVLLSTWAAPDGRHCEACIAGGPRIVGTVRSVMVRLRKELFRS